MYTACSRTRCGASRFPVARRRSKAMANVASFLDATAARQPDGKALVHAARSYSFAALRSMADGVARGLVAEGYGPGSRIALRSEEHTSELQSLMRISYAVFCLNKKHKQQYILY